MMVGPIDGLGGGRTIAMQDGAKSSVIDDSQQAANKPTAGHANTSADTVSLSAGVERLQQIEVAMAGDNMPFDRDKVENIKQRIADGEYVINPDRIAEKFLETEQLLDKL